MQQGANRKLGQFTVSAEVMADQLVQLRSLQFVLETSDVTVSRIRIGGASPLEQADCGIEATDKTRVSCDIIPDAFQYVGSTPITLSIFADVQLKLAEKPGAVQLIAEKRGKIGENGGVRWGDGSGIFNWIEESTPFDSSPRWTVVK